MALMVMAPNTDAATIGITQYGSQRYGYSNQYTQSQSEYFSQCLRVNTKH